MVTKVRLARFTPDMRRDHIIGVAKDVFLDEGYAATSMSTIAERLGGSKATLYKYFPSKEALFEAVMQEHCAVAFAILTDLQLPPDDVRGLLRMFGSRYLGKLDAARHAETRPTGPWRGRAGTGGRAHLLPLRA